MSSPPPKKLIHFGWDVPAPGDVLADARAMERRPFDGVVMRLPDEVGGGKIFDVALWDRSRPERRAEEVATLGRIGWERFTDNFVALYAASTMDWFDDEDWVRIVANARFCARAARAGRCAGLMWDPEPYGPNPWVHAEQPRAGEKSFDDYRVVVRRRGAELMAALGEEFPGLTLLTLRLLSDFGDQSPWSGRVLNERDPAKRDALLPGFYFGLHAAFLEGMLDAAGPDVTIVDGNEDAYYFASALEFYRAYHLIRQEALPLVAPELQATYQARVRVGQGLYLDYLYGGWETLGSFPLHLVRQARELSAEERDRWLEHNVYYALTTADRYAWCYSEGPNWWTGEGLPPGAEAAIIRARRKHDAGEPLGFAVEPMLEEAQARAKARLEAARLARRAGVPRVPPAVGAAVAARKGKHAEGVERLLAPLEPFVPTMGGLVGPEAVALTRAWIGYDEEHLYLALRCDEPRPEQLRATGRDGMADDDRVRVFLAAPVDGTVPRVHEFVLNPGGDRLVVAHGGAGDPTRGVPDGAGRSTTWLGADGWGAALALPWAPLGIAPRAGTRLRANVARQRVADIAEKRLREQTSWSQAIDDIAEPDHFGEWELA